MISLYHVIAIECVDFSIVNSYNLIKVAKDLSRKSNKVW